MCLCHKCLITLKGYLKRKCIYANTSRVECFFSLISVLASTKLKHQFSSSSIPLIMYDHQLCTQTRSTGPNHALVAVPVAVSASGMRTLGKTRDHDSKIGVHVATGHRTWEKVVWWNRWKFWILSLKHILWCSRLSDLNTRESICWCPLWFPSQTEPKSGPAHHHFTVFISHAVRRQSKDLILGSVSLC